MKCSKCGQQLPDDSAFCHRCGARVLSNESFEGTPEETKRPAKSTIEPSEHTERRHKQQNKRKRIIKAVSIVAAVIFVFVLFGYLTTYLIALKSVKNHDYLKAEKMLFAPEITRIHDSRICTFIDAEHYLDIHDNYEEAEKAFKSLAESEYPGAKDELNRTYIKWSQYQVAHENDIAAFETLKNCDAAYPDYSAAMNTLIKELYLSGLLAYKIGDYDLAFDKLIAVYEENPQYERIEDYAILASWRAEQNGSFYCDIDAEHIKRLIDEDFEDFREVLACAYDEPAFRLFLTGTWRGQGQHENDDRIKTKDSFFKLTATGSDTNISSLISNVEEPYDRLKRIVVFDRWAAWAEHKGVLEIESYNDIVLKNDDMVYCLSREQ